MLVFNSLLDYVEEAPSARHSLRRVQQPSRTLGVGRGRRPNMHFSSGGLSPSGAREAVDPIAELLSQLSGVRRAAAVPYDRLLHRHTTSSQQGQNSSISSAQGGGVTAAPGQRRSVFPQPGSGTGGGGQTVILTESQAASMQQQHQHHHHSAAQQLMMEQQQQQQQAGANQKHDKYQFLLDKYVKKDKLF